MTQGGGERIYLLAQVQESNCTLPSYTSLTSRTPQDPRLWTTLLFRSIFDITRARNSKFQLPSVPSTSAVSMAASPLAPPYFTRLAAPLIFGPLFNWTLYGALCVQIFVYSYNFPNDKLFIRVLTCFVFVLETIQTALTGADLYYWFITDFGNAEHLQDSHFAPIDIPIMTAVISFIVQAYFCYRIWKLNRRLLWLCLIVAVCTVTQSTGAVWGAVASFEGKNFEFYQVPVYLWSIPSALADVLIAVAMTLLLRRASGKFSNCVLTRVVRLTIETNALTASVAVTSLVLYAVFPNQVYYALTLDFMGKLYSNTLLVSLNNRIYIRGRLSPGNRDSERPTISVRVRTNGSAGAEPLSRKSSRSDAFQLHEFSRPLSLEKGNDDAVGTDIAPLPATP